jgi:RNA polymerase sigma-70 factor (ECF subfamily)
MSHAETSALPVRAAFEAGRSAYPRVALPFEQFLAHVNRLAPPASALASNGADVFLSAACTRGDRAALAAFESHVAGLTRHLLGAGIKGEAVNDALQLLRERLLMGAVPRIGSYSGRAPFAVWLRVVATRVALNLIDGDRSRRERDVDMQALNRLVAPGEDLETSARRSESHPALQAALDETFASLSDRDRAVLRMFYSDGLSIDAIGAVYRVHRATVARWLNDIQKRAQGEIKRRLALRLRPTSSEFRSLVELVVPDLTVRLSRLAGP